MLQAFVCFVVLVLTALIVAVSISGWSTRMRKVVWLGFFAHVAAAFAFTWVHRYLYGFGDAISYYNKGLLLARYVRTLGQSGLSDVVSLILHDEHPLPFHITGEGTSTGTMTGVATLLALGTKSFWVINFVCGQLAFFGQLMALAALRPLFVEEARPRLAWAWMLIPSVVFWSAGLVKEGFALFGMGSVLIGMSKLLQEKRAIATVSIVFGVMVLSLIKAYLLFPLSGAMAAWLYWRGAIRSGRQDALFRPARLITIGAVAAGLFLALGTVFPRYALANFGEQASQERFDGAHTEGGSNYTLGDSQDTSFIGQLLIAPLGILTVLFRPLIVEVRNAAMLVSAAETLVILFLFLRLLRKRGVRGTWRRLKASPTLIFAAAMTLAIALGIGVTTTNLGTLSRYRIPMMPFYLMLLLMLDSDEPTVEQDLDAPVRS